MFSEICDQPLRPSLLGSPLGEDPEFMKDITLKDEAENITSLLITAFIDGLELGKCIGS